MSSLKRLQNDFQEIQQKIEDGEIYEAIDAVRLRGNNLRNWIVLFHGLPKTPTPLEGGQYCMEITFPQDFPNAGPTCHMTGGFHHMHVYQFGKICHPLVNRWTYSTTCEQLISEIIRMLHSEPIIGDQASNAMKALVDPTNKTATRFDKYYAKMREQSKNFINRTYY